MVRVITNTLGQTEYSDSTKFVTLSKDVKKTNLCDIKVPYVIKDKLFIGPGTWNGYYYSPEELQKAYNMTDWELKENRNLFLDHDDQSVSSWVGMAENLYMDDGSNLRGDLIVIDLPTARKLAFGAKFGISCKLGGEAKNGAITDFTYENHSVVITPAVKMAYINNSKDIDLEQVTALETKRKELGMTVSEFYAISRDPPSDSKLPIFDAEHVRNAIARFNQIKDVTNEEKETAKIKIRKASKKFGIKTELAFEKLNDSQIIQENKKEVNTMSEITKELEDMVMNSAWTDFVKKMRAENPDMSFADIAKKFKDRGTETKKPVNDDVKENSETETKSTEKIVKAEIPTELSDLIAKLSAKMEEMDTKMGSMTKSLSDMETSKVEDVKVETATVESTVEDTKVDTKDVEVKKDDVVVEEKKDDVVETTESVKTEEAVVENKSKDVKELSSEPAKKVTVATTVETKDETTTKELSVEELDTQMRKSMFTIQGSEPLA